MNAERTRLPNAAHFVCWLMAVTKRQPAERPIGPRSCGAVGRCGGRQDAWRTTGTAPEFGDSALPRRTRVVRTGRAAVSPRRTRLLETSSAFFLGT